MKGTEIASTLSYVFVVLFAN